MAGIVHQTFFCPSCTTQSTSSIVQLHEGRSPHRRGVRHRAVPPSPCHSPTICMRFIFIIPRSLFGARFITILFQVWVVIIVNVNWVTMHALLRFLGWCSCLASHPFITPSLPSSSPSGDGLGAFFSKVTRVVSSASLPLQSIFHGVAFISSVAFLKSLLVLRKEFDSP